MKIQREELLKVLKRVAPILKVRTTMAELSTLKINAINGRFHAVSTDLDSYCEAVCFCEGDLETCCVAPGPLIAVCSYGPDKVELIKDGTRLNIKGGNTARLSALSPENYPTWPKDTTEVIVNAVDLREAIQSVMWAGDTTNQFAGIERQSVWVMMDTQKHTLQAVCMEGKRFAWFQRKAVVPNAQMRFMCNQAPVLCDTLTGSDPRVRVSDSFVEVRTLEGCCAVKQTEKFKLPIEMMAELIAQAIPAWSIPKDAFLTELATIRSVAADPFPYTKATFTKEGLSLDYVGKVNEFRSVVAVVRSASAQSRDKGNTDPPLSICFDASLLHSVIKNTPGENLACKVGERMVVFESGDVTTALALVDPKMYP